MNAQFRFITDMLPKIDQVVVPDNTFEVAYARAKPVQRDALLNPANETVPVNEGLDRPTAVKGLTNTGPTSIAIELTTGEGPSEEDKAAAAAKRSAYLAQNALPEHFTHSTITGEQIVPTSAPAASTMFLVKKDEDEKKIVMPSFGGEGEAIDDYFAQLKAEQAREAEQEAEEEFETDDEDDEFEDVVPSANGAGSAAATPVSALKSAEASRRSSPAGGTGAESEESGPPSKRVRISEEKQEELKKVEEADSEEDEEFEDV